MTSHDVVSRVRRVLNTRAVGHTGTLDPFATGLLVVLVGRATRLARFVEQQPKTYLATARLGVRTTTDDLTGEVEIPTAPAAEALRAPTRSEVAAALAAFLGPQRQRPSTFSAKKIGGERAYARARRGERVELVDSAIVVYALDLVEYEYPALQFRTTVSAGTYVRALARDLGERLGTGAHLTALRREAIGSLRVEAATALDAITPEGLLPPIAVLGHLPRITVPKEAVGRLGFGQAIAVDGASPVEGPVLAVGAGDALLAVGRLAEARFHPEVVLESAG